MTKVFCQCLLRLKKNFTLWHEIIEFNGFSVLLLELKSPNYSLAILLKCITQTSKYIVRTPLFLQGRLSLQPNFRKWGLDKTSAFRGGLLGKRGWLFSGGGDCDFHIKIKLKSEIFNDKKCWSAKIFFSVITKNSNWEILIFLGFTEKSNF